MRRRKFAKVLQIEGTRWTRYFLPRVEANEKQSY